MGGRVTLEATLRDTYDHSVAQGKLLDAVPDSMFALVLSNLAELDWRAAPVMLHEQGRDPWPGPVPRLARRDRLAEDRTADGRREDAAQQRHFLEWMDLLALADAKPERRPIRVKVAAIHRYHCTARSCRGGEIIRVLRIVHQCEHVRTRGERRRVQFCFRLSCDEVDFREAYTGRSRERR